MKVLATYSIKGGVGKTSTAVNLAHAAAGDGLRTLLWDLDPQGAATYLLRVKTKVRGGAARLVSGQTDVRDLLRATDIEGIDLLPADMSYRHMDIVLSEGKRPAERLSRVLRPLRSDYDLTVLDCPPSISQVSESVFATADVLLVPVIPTALSMRTFDQLRRFVSKEVDRPPEIVGFLSLVDRRKLLHRAAVESLSSDRPGFALTVIPSTIHVENMGVLRAPVAVSAPRSAAARAYAALWAEVRERLWGR